MKWEDKIKETLEKRSIAPSKASWNTLADQLDAAEKNKSKGLYLWMSVAASLIAILFTVNVFFNNSSVEVQNPILVETQEHDKNLLPVEKVPEQQRLAETHKENQSQGVLEKSSSKKEVLNQQNTISSPIKQSPAVAKNEKAESIKPLPVIPQKDIIEDQKVLEIVAQMQDLKSNGQTVTDADIDALLQQAQKEIAYQTISKESTTIVDANALLQDVETDLQQSFRNKIFEALKNSYETVKTAVAERKN